MKLFLTILLIMSPFWGSSQYGNEWIDYSQQYYSFKIIEDGIYKLDYNILNSSGVPVTTISPEDFQIFGFETEQSILVEDGGDGTFDFGDYILFYAQKNTTWLDSLMYDIPENVGNRYYPHYNDTITYFLTWNNLSNHSRITEESDVNFSAYSPNIYLFKKSYNEHHNYYAEGLKIEGLSYSAYVEGEGWTSSPVNATAGAGYFDDNISTPFAFNSAGAPNVRGEAVSVSVSNASTNNASNHHLQLQYGTSNTVIHDLSFIGYQKNNLNISFPGNGITSNTTRIRHQLINDLGVATDYQSVAFVELIYPHLTNLEGSSYIELISENHPSSNKTRYDFTNFNSVNPIAFSFGGQIKKLPIQNNAGIYQVIVPNNPINQEQKILFLDENEIIDIPALKPVNQNGYFTDFTQLNFDKAYIIITHSSLTSSATDYKTYRESPAGGNKNVIMAYVDELNLQFGGGVPKHIMGVRRFQDFAYNNIITDRPSHVFLLGKGVREANESINTGAGARQSTNAYNYCLIPCFGYPASDMVTTHHMEGNGWAPLIPIGRIAAKNNTEVLLYLNKVKEFELAQDSTAIYDIESKYWQKNILHFGGGSTTAEQITFKSYLNVFENTLENPNFGGNVQSFYKTVSDPIDPVTLYEVTDVINEGVSIMTFFGHAAADGFDQNVDDPENWDNKGKYPLVVGNACLVGNIQEPTDQSSSEEFVLIEDKGAIAFLANVKSAYSNGLFSFSSQLFSHMSQDYYGATLGEIIQVTIDDIQQNGLPFSVQIVINQMTLHGDPSLKINPHNRPELEVNNTSIFVEPEVVDLTIDSIDVNVVIHNMGMSAIDTFAVELYRSFPNNGGDSLYTKLVPGINYIDTIIFKIPLYANMGVGINSFTVKIDVPSVIDEQYDEVFNNQITKQVIFDIDGIYPVWPYDYAVVPHDTLILKGSTVNPFASSLSYRFEIDTTDLFNSPEHRYSNKISLGGVVEIDYNQWYSATTNSPNELILQDSLVYFWRTSVNDPTNFNWIENSFQYINGKSGWGQDHFFQFKNNDFTFLNYDRNERLRLFDPAFKTIECEVYGNATSWLQTAYTLWKIDGDLSEGEYNFCSIEPAFLVCVVDPFTLKAWGTRWFDGVNWQNPTHNFGNSNDNGGCRNRVENHFSFYQNNPTQMAAMENMLTNEIPDGYSVLIYTARYLNYPEWDSNSPQLYSLFQNLGSDSIMPGQGNVPYIGYYESGNADSYIEVYGANIAEHIILEDTLWGYDYNGFETSTIVGPAQEWKTVYWKQDAMENPTKDTTRLFIYGLTNTGTEELLIDTLFSNHDSIVNFNSIVSADDYPYIKLQSQNVDTIDFTPSQIDGWHVLYTPVPEAAITSVNGYYLTPTDTVKEGQDLTFAFDVTNISNLPMDSILIKYWIEDSEHNIIPIPYPRQDSLRVSQIIRDTINIHSLGLKNLNSLWIEVNPYTGNSILTDQPEQYHFNNIGQIPFFVKIDNENPILDVTFNGYHILNGDLIDPKSEILITLKDENDFLIMSEETDTSFFGLYLTDPEGSQKRLNFRNQNGETLLEWIPADASTKKFKIIHEGDFTIDGTYRLLVQGSDKSGNLSGNYEYDIEFEVDHNSSITSLMNYPNPFSTQTQFVFTLTGAVIPEEFTIQIMTISGKVVKEITVDELGPIHIGRNITDYRWQGRDEFGDLLANGVYLYRVITKIEGENVEHRESGADNYISKGFGKMYIIR
jgi:hypothetical protein